MVKSCLVSRLTRYVDLTEGEQRAIATFERDEVSAARNHVLIEPGTPATLIHVLKTGWAAVRSEAQDGRRQLLRIYLPGEVIGLAELGLPRALHRVTMQTDGVICPLPRTALRPILDEHPRLAGLFMAIGSLDQIALRQHLSSIGTMSANHRLKFFLLQLRTRLLVANVGMGDRFQLPFSQIELGEALGITSIYVNKLLRGMVRAGEIEIDRPYIRLTKRQEWEAEVNFHDDFRDMDISWFPKAND